jgi:superfamily II DNA or RNA helicase
VVEGGTFLIELRDYQTEAIHAFNNAREEGEANRFLLTAATGAGKTIMSAFIMRDEVRQRKGRCLFLCHRDELLRQTVDKLALVDDTLRVGLIQADRDDWGHDYDVIVASVQTISGKKRLPRYPRDLFSLIVVDETHRAVARSYLDVLTHFRAFETENPPVVIGITATAERTDKEGLDRVYQKHVFDIGLVELIERGALVPIRAITVETHADLSGVKKRMGDFSEGQLASVLNTQNRNSLIAEAIKQYAADRKSVVFCVNVQHSLDLAETMRRAGIPAAAIHGGQSIEERRRILQDFREGRIQALTNCQILVEGFDEPSIDAVVWATHTMSKIKYMQGIGRGTRLSPGKTDLLVIDCADVCGRHSLMSVPALFGLGAVGERALRQGKNVLQAKAAEEEAKREEERRRKEAEKEVVGRGIMARTIDLFSQSSGIPGSQFQWLTVSRDRYMLPLFGEQVHIYRSIVNPEVWHVAILDSNDFKPKMTFGTLASLQGAVQIAEAHLNQYKKWIKDKFKSMLQEAPTEGQIVALRKCGEAIPDTKLAAFQLIALRVAQSHFRRLRRIA